MHLISFLKAFNLRIILHETRIKIQRKEQDIQECKCQPKTILGSKAGGQSWNVRQTK